MITELQSAAVKELLRLRTGEKTGNLISIKEVNDNDELVIITNGGMVIRQAVKNLRVMGRATQGVRLINLKDGDSIADVARVISEDEDDGAEQIENNDQLDISEE